MRTTVFSDNRFVRRAKYGGWYFAVYAFDDCEADEAELVISRYCVPGRVDAYRFDFVDHCNNHGASIRYHSEANTPLAEAVKSAQSDLDKPAVAKMLVGLCGKRKARRLLALLISEVAPKSKSAKAMRRELKKNEKK